MPFVAGSPGTLSQALQGAAVERFTFQLGHTGEPRRIGAHGGDRPYRYQRTTGVQGMVHPLHQIGLGWPHTRTVSPGAQQSGGVRAVAAVRGS